MPDAWRAYLEMALGLTEAPRKKAQQVAGDLVNRGGATAGQLQGLVEDLLSAGLANREALTNIVRYEVDKALGVVGLATAEEVSELTTRVRDLEKRLRDAQARAAAAEAAPEGTRLDQPAPLPRKAVKKAAPNAMPSAGRIAATSRPNAASTNIGADAPPGEATTSPVKAARARKVAPGTAAPAGKAAPGFTVPAGKAMPDFSTPAKKTVAKKAVAKKTVAKKAPAKKVAPPVERSGHAEPEVPAGTVQAPTAAVKEAAAETELPPVRKTAPVKKAAGRAAKKTPPKPEA
jgi:polyhydroxyalkanoate synthesis regulator phasin